MEIVWESRQENNLTLSRWNPHDPIVNRENFTDFLITSFRIARASSLKHQIFFRWCELKGSVKPKDVLDNFLEHGGWDSLTGEEQRLIFEAFNNTPEHFNKLKRFGENPKERLTFQIKSTYPLGEVPDSEMCEMLDIGSGKKISDLSYNELIQKIKNIKNDE